MRAREFQHLADGGIGRHGDRVADDAGFEFLDAAHFVRLALRRDVLVDNAETPFLGQADGGARLRDRVHGRRQQRDIEADGARQGGFQVHVLGQDGRMRREQQDIVKGEAFLNYTHAVLYVIRPAAVNWATHKSLRLFPCIRGLPARDACPVDVAGNVFYRGASLYTVKVRHRRRKMKQTLMIGTLVVALAGCASVVRDDEYTQLMVQAENEIKLADKTGFLWRDTEKFLKDSKEAKDAADKAMKDGDRATAAKEFDKAMKLAQKAMKQAQMAQQQARDNTNPVASFK